MDQHTAIFEFAHVLQGSLCDALECLARQKSLVRRNQNVGDRQQAGQLIILGKKASEHPAGFINERSNFTANHGMIAIFRRHKHDGVTTLNAEFCEIVY